MGINLNQGATIVTNKQVHERLRKAGALLEVMKLIAIGAPPKPRGMSVATPVAFRKEELRRMAAEVVADIWNRRQA